ncbi:hypothetical protein ACOMHN_051378 [Nucella lapillus]
MSGESSAWVQRLVTPLGTGSLENHELRTVVFVAVSFQMVFTGYSLENHELRTVVFVTVSFQMVFTGYRSIQNLQSSLNEENGLGVISLGVLYGAWIFSGFFTPTAIRLLTTKGALMVAWVFHVLYTTCTFYPAWELIVPASFLVGIFSAPLWTSQSLYITACGYSIAKGASGSPYHTFSRFNGIFFAIYETSQITGNLISSAVLHNGVGNGSQQIHFRQCRTGDCPLADNATDFEEPQPWVMDVLLGIYIACGISGLLMTYIFVIPLPKSDWTIEASTKQTVTSFFVTLRHTSIGLLVPMFIFQGMQQAILYSEFTRSYISCPLGIHMVGYVMATHGATTPLTTWLFSRLVKLTGRYVLFVLAGAVNLGLMVVMYFWTPDQSHRPFIFLAPILWGVSEGIWLTQSNSLIAVQFSRQKEPAFAIYHTCRSVGLALTFAYSSSLCASVKLQVALAFVLLALSFYTVSEYRIQRREKLRQKSSNGSVSHLALSTVSGLAGLSSSDSASAGKSKLLRRSQTGESVGRELTETEFDNVVFVDSTVEYGDPDVFSRSSPHDRPVVMHFPRVASSSTSILCTLSAMARLSQEEEDEFVESLPTKTLVRLSASLSEEERYF